MSVARRRFKGPSTLSARIAYIECLLGAGLDTAAYADRLAAIAAGDIPDVTDVVNAYFAAYEADVGDADKMVEWLDLYIDDRRRGLANGLADFFEDSFNPEGVNPRLDIVTAPAKTPPARRQKPAARNGGVKPEDQDAHTPLPGQDSFAFEAGAEAVEYDDEELAALRRTVDQDTAAAVARQASKGALRPWPANIKVSYRVNRHWLLGTLLEDHGDGRITMTRDARPDEPPWVVSRARCKKLQTTEPAAPPAEPAESVRLEVPEGDLVWVCGQLALAHVPDYADDADLAAFLVNLPDNGAVLASVVNGTPAVGRRPYVRIWVFDNEERLTYEHPPADYLVGTHMIAVAGRPVRLDVVAVA